MGAEQSTARGEDEQDGLPSALVIVGPSGVGKGTLIHKLMSESDSFGFSCSHTTRKPRDGEKVPDRSCQQLDHQVHDVLCRLKRPQNVHAHRLVAYKPFYAEQQHGHCRNCCQRHGKTRMRAPCMRVVADTSVHVQHCKSFMNSHPLASCRGRLLLCRSAQTHG